MVVDKYHLLGQIQLDGSVEGGDTINWMGHRLYHESDFFGWTPEKLILFFEVGFGGYVRHFDPNQTYHGFGAYYKNPYNGVMSRDQLTGLVGMMVKRKQYYPLFRLTINHLARLGLFAYNTRTNGTEHPDWKIPDFTGPDFWAMILRGFGVVSWIFWPLLVILDLHMLINVLIVNRKNEDDVISFYMKYRVSRDFIPTPTSYLSEKLLNKDKLKGHLKNYWCGWRQQPEMYELMSKNL